MRIFYENIIVNMTNQINISLGIGLGGIIAASIFSLLFSYTPYYFILLICLYIAGYGAYMFYVMLKSKQKELDQVHLDIGLYMSIVNTVLVMIVFIAAVVMRKRFRFSVCGY